MKRCVTVFTLGLALALCACNNSGSKDNDNKQTDNKQTDNHKSDDHKSDDGKSDDSKSDDSNSDDSNSDDSNSDDSNSDNVNISCDKSKLRYQRCSGNKIIRCMPDANDDADDSYIWSEYKDCGTNSHCVEINTDDFPKAACACDPSTFIPDPSKNSCSETGYQNDDTKVFSTQVCELDGDNYVVKMYTSFCSSCDQGSCVITDADKGIGLKPGDACQPKLFNTHCGEDGVAYNCAGYGNTSVGYVVAERCTSGGCKVLTDEEFSMAYCQTACGEESFSYEPFFVTPEGWVNACAMVLKGVACNDGQSIPAGYSLQAVGEDEDECSEIGMMCSMTSAEMCGMAYESCLESYDPELCNNIECEENVSLYYKLCDEDNSALFTAFCAEKSSDECDFYNEMCDSLYDLETIMCHVSDSFILNSVVD